MTYREIYFPRRQLRFSHIKSPQSQEIMSRWMMAFDRSFIHQRRENPFIGLSRTNKIRSTINISNRRREMYS